MYFYYCDIEQKKSVYKIYKKYLFKSEFFAPIFSVSLQEKYRFLNVENQNLQGFSPIFNRFLAVVKWSKLSSIPMKFLSKL